MTNETLCDEMTNETLCDEMTDETLRDEMIDETLRDEMINETVYDGMKKMMINSITIESTHTSHACSPSPFFFKKPSQNFNLK